MDKMAALQKIKKLYKKDKINIIQYLKENQIKENTIEDIMISYDFQAGNYVQQYLKDPNTKKKFLSRLVKIFETLPGRKSTIFEPGIGEATTLVPFLNMIGKQVYAGGGDISWSRVKTARKFASEYLNKQLAEIDLVMADMFSLPLADDSVDVVYTVHAMEPNGGHEKELLQELYRVAGEYLILLEPAYELANQEAKSRMERNGYIRNLYQNAKDLGYNVLTWELYGEAVNSLNPTGLMIIQKQTNQERPNELKFADPVTKTYLNPIGTVYYSKESLLAYPIVNGVPCLLREHALVATKMLDLL